MVGQTNRTLKRSCHNLKASSGPGKPTQVASALKPIKLSQLSAQYMETSSNPIQADPCSGGRIRRHNLRLINTVSRTKVKGVGRRGGNSEYQSLHYTLFNQIVNVSHSVHSVEQSKRLCVGMVSITPLSSIPAAAEGEYMDTTPSQHFTISHQTM